MIFRRLVLSPRLHAVVPVAKRLPVAPVPEQLHVTTVRNDVIHVRRLHVPAFLHALHAQRVSLKILFPGFPPSAAVTSAGSGPYFLRMQCFVFLTILLPRRNKRCATGMPARDLWFCRHSLLLSRHRKRPGSAWLQDLFSSFQSILYHKKTALSVSSFLQMLNKRWYWQWQSW